MSYHLHWSFEQLMTLDHGERRRWVKEVARINQRLNGEEPGMSIEQW